MRITSRRLNLGMVQCALDDLEVAGLPQQLGCKVVPEIMEAEVLHPCVLGSLASTPCDDPVQKVAINISERRMFPPRVAEP